MRKGLFCCGVYDEEKAEVNGVGDKTESWSEVDIKLDLDITAFATEPPMPTVTKEQNSHQGD
jgi:hypothetical protein